MVRHAAQPSTPSKTSDIDIKLSSSPVNTSSMDVAKVLESARACFESEIIRRRSPNEEKALTLPTTNCNNNCNTTDANNEELRGHYTNVRRRRVVARNGSISAPVSPDPKAVNNNNTIMISCSADLNKVLVSPLKSTPSGKSSAKGTGRSIFKRQAPEENAEDEEGNKESIKTIKFTPSSQNVATSASVSTNVATLKTTTATITFPTTSANGHAPSTIHSTEMTVNADPMLTTLKSLPHLSDKDGIVTKETVEDKFFVLPSEDQTGLKRTNKSSPSSLSSSSSTSKKRFYSEVQRLRQDEGIQMMLDAISSSTRRKVTTTKFNFNKGYASNSKSSVSHNILQKPTSNTKSCARADLRVNPPCYVKGNSTEVATYLNLEKSKRKSKSVTTLMDNQTLAKLNQLDKSVYLQLCANQSRYKLTNHTRRTLSREEQERQVQSEQINTTSAPLPGMPQKNRLVGNPSLSMMDPSLGLRDVHLRCSEDVGQLILNPLSTGLKASFNVNVFEEMGCALHFLLHQHCCRIILITGLGAFFSQGIDLTQLSFESTERQRRSASQLSVCIRGLVSELLDAQKPLICGLNGSAVGLGVTLLPFFDAVYASDKAELRCDYNSMGQMPEAFATHTMLASNSMRVREFFSRDRSISAQEAHHMGLVSEVFLPDGFMQTLMPRLNKWALQLKESESGHNRGWLKRAMRRDVVPIMDEETKELMQCWTQSLFVTRLKHRLKTDPKLVFQ